MERLLGHKMLYGRLESYNSMGYVKVDPPPESALPQVNYNKEVSCYDAAR